MSDIPGMLERYRRGPEVIATLMTGAAGPELDFRSEADHWTLRQIVAHLADSEIVSAARFRSIIAEDNPTLMGFDQNAWAANLNYARRKTSESVDMFRRLRAECYELLKDLPPETFARQGNHSEFGPMTLRQLLQRMAEHAEGHARQIQQVREAYRSARRARA